MDDESLSTAELAERQGSTVRYGRGGEPSAEPDVLLDVPQLRVEEIILEVEDLRAHVSVQAEVLNLLRLQRRRGCTARRCPPRDQGRGGPSAAEGAAGQGRRDH